MTTKPNEEITGHPSQDNTDRFEFDQLLRSHGWSIYSRPKNDVARWQKGDLVVTQGEALKLIRKGRLREEC